MTKKLLIGLFTILAIAISTFYIWTAHLARVESDHILSEFKKIDSSITVQNTSQNDGVGAIKIDSSSIDNLELSLKANEILTRVDSIKNDLLQLTNREQMVSFSPKNLERLRVIKMDLIDYNFFIQKHFKNRSNIETSDFIDVSDQIKGTIHVPWEIHFFQKTDFYAASTLLTFVHHNVLALQQKAIKGD